MDKKLNPMQMVAREMANHSKMTANEFETAFIGLLDHLQARARVEIDADPNSEASRNAAMQYRAASETIAAFGTQLIAFDDMEDEISRDVSDVISDEVN